MHDDNHDTTPAPSDEENSLPQQRQLELQRLEKLLNCWYPIATSKHLQTLILDQRENPDLEEEAFEMATKAVPLVLRIMERKAELLGLDHPEEQPNPKMKEKSLTELTKILKTQNPHLFLSPNDYHNSQRPLAI